MVVLPDLGVHKITYPDADSSVNEYLAGHKKSFRELDLGFFFINDDDACPPSV